MPLDVPQDICDQCKAVKKEGNHWWVVGVATVERENVPFSRWSILPLHRLSASDRKDVPDLIACCSKSCAIQALSTWMDKQSV